jgi:poly(hydroxyalkanoate) depolymerase family esterase
MPLVIMLHGCQQTPQEMAMGSRMNRLADAKGFVVAYPQQAKRVQAMRCWRWFQPDARHGLAEADAIADLAGAIVRKYRLDASRVYIAGLSAGAGMAGLVALRHPRVFAAAAMHSGAVLGAAQNAATGLRTMRQGSTADPADLIKPLVDNSKPFPGLPVMILHGKRDHVVSVRNAAQLAHQFGSINGVSIPKESVLAQGTHREYARQDFLKGKQVAVRVCLLKEVGHAWSGGDSKLKFNSKEGPGASVLIWQFFCMHSR